MTIAAFLGRMRNPRRETGRQAEPAELPPPPLGRGTLIGDRYSLIEPLGKGGMGVVFRVRHRTLDKEFALKMIRADSEDRERARAMFDREAKLASSLSHPNIVSIVDFGEDLAYGAYMVMELVDGQPLTDRLAAGPLPVRLACELMAQTADALRYIHDHRIIHGDIKAENILLVTDANTERRRSRIVLLDFGLARPRLVAPTSTVLDGTPEYTAPERILGEPPSVATDIYSLGVLFYVLLTGQAPFTGSVEETLHGHVSTPPEMPSRIRGEALDDRLQSLVLRALAKEPSHRHPDVGRFLYELRTVMDMLGMSRRRRVRRAESAEDGKPDRVGFAAAAFDRCPLPMATISRDGVVLAANPAFAGLAARRPDVSVEGTYVALSRLASTSPGLLQEIGRALATGIAWTGCLACLPGELPRMISIVPHDDAGSAVHVTIANADEPA